MQLYLYCLIFAQIGDLEMGDSQGQPVSVTCIYSHPHHNMYSIMNVFTNLQILIAYNQLTPQTLAKGRKEYSLSQREIVYR